MSIVLCQENGVLELCCFSFLYLCLFSGSYSYGGQTYKALASSGSSVDGCKIITGKALRIRDTCTHMKCTFGGVWNGGGGDGQRNLFVASFFFDRAAEVKFLAWFLLLMG